MNSVQCSCGKGMCTIPGRTAVAAGGEVSIRSRAEVEKAFPDLDLSEADLRPLDLPESDTSLHEAVESDPATWAVIENALRASESPHTTASIIVQCVPCDHKWIAVHEHRSYEQQQQPAVSP
jgi:hypothetical protein